MTTTDNPSRLNPLSKKKGPADPASPASHSDRRGETRFERAKVESHAEHIFVRIKEKGRTVQTEVLDLSAHGLCFRAKPAFDFFGIGSTINLNLMLGGREHALTTKLVHKRGPYASCRIVEPSAEWAEEVENYLGPLEMGQHLREIRPRFVDEQDPASRFHWFRSGPSCDLFYWSEPGDGIRKFQLVYASNVVEWTPARGFRTGRLAPVSAEADSSGAREYDCQSPANPKLVAAARRIIFSASVPDPVKGIFA